MQLLFKIKLLLQSLYHVWKRNDLTLEVLEAIFSCGDESLTDL